METPLLQTKLAPPLALKSLVPRPHLLRRLEHEFAHPQGFSRKLTLFSAPAGYGKSTLAIDWLRDSGLPFSWLSLEESDNDPVRLLTYLIAALQLVDKQIGKNAQSLLAAPQKPPHESLLTALINDIQAHGEPVILVLDDYHAIQDPGIHKLTSFLLAHQPDCLHLVILTREEPPLPLHRLRARRQMVEMRQGDLGFTTAETETFLKQVMGIQIDLPDVDALNRRTEGWVAGLQLAALSLQSAPDSHAFVQSFTGSNRYVLDYLFEEVFLRQPPEVQSFLLTTSILERLTAPLCDTLSGRSDSQSQLEALEKANLFIEPLDSARRWYRYHRLFADLLRHRLRVSHPGLETELHNLASQWFEAKGLIYEAIQHALAAQDWEQSAKLIGLAADRFLKRGELVTLIGWCQQVPEELIRSQPEFGMSYAWALLLLGSFSEAEKLLVDFEEIGQSAPMLLGQVAAAQAYAARAKGDNRRVIEKSELALGLLSDSDFVSRSVLSLNLGLVYWHEGRLREAVPVLNDAYELATRVENHYGSLTAQIFLARTLASQGALRQAEEQLRKTLQVGGKHPILVLAHYDLAGIYYEWNDLTRAWEHLEQGLDICTRSGNVEFQNGGHMLKACLLMAQGNMLEALAEAETTHALSQDYGPVTQARSKSCHAQIALAMGDVATAKLWVEQISEDVDVNSFYRFIGLTKARLLLAQGDKAAATVLFKERLARATQAGWGYATVAIRALQAQAAETEGEALKILAEGLKLSQPEGFIRTYVEAGVGLVPLLKESARRGMMPVYIGQILSAYDVRAKPTLPLVEPLSERELEVLRLMAAGLSNREIAHQLVLSLGTVKTHLHNIYGKLEARNRLEAVERARELELL